MVYIMSRVTGIPVVEFSDHIRHKPGFIATEEGLMPEIWDLGSRVIELFM